MSKKLKVVFFGTPDFAVHILDKIIESKHEVLGVVTTPDKSAGRGRKIHSSAVANYAKVNDLKLFQPQKLKSKEFLADLEKLSADIFVVVAFRKLPKIVWQMPVEGTFNLHASLLPNYRGAAPINWAIINGEKKSGVTTFFIDENIDTGKMILQKECMILPEDNAGDLHDKLMILGGETTVETLDLISEGSVVAKKQEEHLSIKDAPKLFKENTKIDWSDSIEYIYNFVRGLNPYPTAWTYFSKEEEKKYVKLLSVEIEKAKPAHPVGKIFSEKNKIGISHQDGIVWVKSLQMEGKKRMYAQDFLNGFGSLEGWMIL